MVHTAADKEHAGVLCPPLRGPGDFGVPLWVAAQTTSHCDCCWQAPSGCAMARYCCCQSLHVINVIAYIEYGTHILVQNIIWRAWCNSTEVSQQLQVMPHHTSHSMVIGDHNFDEANSTLACLHALYYNMPCSCHMYYWVADGIHICFCACATAFQQ